MSSNSDFLCSLEIPDCAWFEFTEGGLTSVVVKTPLAQARVYLHGAHVAHYQKAGQPPLLFMSAATHLAPGKAIRGGIPLIFPWFGGLPENPQAPAHGFARTTAWTVESLKCEEEVVTLVLTLNESAQTLENWPHAFALRYTVVIGWDLRVSLEVGNTSSAPFTFENALHSYFSVSDVRSTPVVGLDGIEYIDKVDAATRKTQSAEPLLITGETDRVYLNTRATCLVNDPGLSRQISIAKEGSESTVVWSPWMAKAKAMADFGDEEWPTMICVESANAADNRVTLAAGAKHTLSAVLSERPL